MLDDTEISDGMEEEQEEVYHSNPEVDKYYREMNERAKSGETWSEFVVWWRGLVGAMNSGAKHEAIRYR